MVPTRAFYTAHFFEQVEHAWLDLGELDKIKLSKLNKGLNSAETRVCRATHVQHVEGYTCGGLYKTGVLIHIRARSPWFMLYFMYTSACHAQENALESLATIIKRLGEDQGRLKGVGVQKGHASLTCVCGVLQGSCLSME